MEDAQFLIFHGHNWISASSSQNHKILMFAFENKSFLKDMGTFYAAGLLLVVVLLLVETTQFCLGGNSSLSCVEGERQALLKFKQSLNDPSHRLSSWKGTDCCKWKGVSCSMSTGHVVKLDLRMTNAIGDYRDWDLSKQLMAQEVNSGLLELRYLNYLDLSCNNFQGTPIPKFLGLMERLRYLNLSHANFGGMVPPQLGNLSNLRVLDLNIFEEPTILTTLNVEWVSHLSALQHLDMSGVGLGGARNVMQVLNMLPSLLVLRLAWCGLHYTHLSQASANSTFLSSVEYLDLCENSFQGPFPHVLQNMTSLRVLDLSSNYFNSSIPLCLGNFRSLVHLNLASNEFNSINGGLSKILWNLCYLKSVDLSFNSLLHGELLESQRNLTGYIEYDLEELSLDSSKFSGRLPDQLGQLTKLKHLDLSLNLFSGPIPASLGKLLALKELYLFQNFLNGTLPKTLGELSSLRELDLSYNQLTGIIAETMGKLSNLRVLDLSNNQLNGTIPKALGELSSLRELDLSFNQLNGVIPDSLGKILNLETLDISSNSLEGKLSEVHFANLSRLELLDISSNYRLAFEAKSDWQPPFQLDIIIMSSSKIGTPPQWLRTQKGLTNLFLSNASISGPIPKWFQDLHVSTLDLSHNQISGRFPNLPHIEEVILSNNLISGPLPQNIGHMMPALIRLYLDQNLINGKIPSSLCEIETLSSLDLSNNSLSGSIPNCWGNLWELYLSNNRLSGKIPCCFGFLGLLDLSNNRLFGNIPNFGRDSLGLYNIDLSSNMLTGPIPSSFGHLSYLAWLHLNNNSLNGELPSALRNCTELIVLDLGENKFSGNIPKWIGEKLGSLQILRLRDNTYNGSIPPQICNLLHLKILDLAYNNLMGTIPPCFGNFDGMAHEEDLPSIYGKSYPSTMGNWAKQKVVEVMKGTELEFEKITLLVVNMDLSSNNLVGMIPEELTILSILIGLNLSHNHLTGNIPKNIGNLRSLESLDFSSNHLSGLIPQSMSALTSLSHLNLSYNNLSGQIPTGNQLQTLNDPFIYAGNLELCGAPLPNKCPGDEPHEALTPIGHEENDKEDVSEKVWFYIVVMLGFMTGLWGTLGVLIFKKSWRYAYFRFVDETKDWIIVAIAVKVARLKKKTGRNRRVK